MGSSARHGHITDKTVSERIAVGIPARLASLPMREIVYMTQLSENYWNTKLMQLRKTKGAA